MDIFELDGAFVLHTYARRKIAFERGKNATLFDQNGKDYIDFASGLGVNSVGYGNERLAAAIADQASKIIHSSNLYTIDIQALLAERIVKLSGLDARVFFANSGAEANEGAIKLARKYGQKSGRFEIITLRNSFHGRTIATLKATGQEKFHACFGPFPDGFIYAADVEDVLRRIGGKTVAVMVELVQGEGGVLPLDVKAVQNLAAELKKRDILLIVDEVQTGVFRSGEFIASIGYSIEPDIFTLAKGLGGGVPIGAVITTKKELFEYGDHASTFGGNFLSSRAAYTTLEILEELKNSGELARTIGYFTRKNGEIAAKYPRLFLGEAGVGLMRALIARDDAVQQAVLEEAHKEQVLVLRSGSSRVRMLPPLTISQEEIELGFQRLEGACRAVDS
ncbi:MAG: aminotransferase class III-fold pyridoxal phosphate-dependent enzyme [Helicobacteraceae bacterium]|jgi:acetylornithine aminotransferase|nr:aminotransferase class III-fold pyridoxal phosphate-dependent enzyme [Helicobacteraceae bacterium]